MARQEAQLAQLLSEAVSGLHTDLREEECGVFVYAAQGSGSIAHAAIIAPSAAAAVVQGWRKVGVAAEEPRSLTCNGE